MTLADICPYFVERLSRAMQTQAERLAGHAARKHSLPMALAAGLLLAALLPATAGELDGNNGLPGVSGGYAIVKPKPEPHPDEPPVPRHPRDDDGSDTGRGMTFQAGDFEVNVSGSVSVEIGFGERQRGDRH